MTHRRTLTAVTLFVLVGILAVGALYGWRALSAPIPDRTVTAKPQGPTCASGLRKGDKVRTKDVTVSIYNAGTRSGLAGQTQDQLRARGFIAGDIGNAPEDLSGVRFVRVLAPRKTDPAARLVARQFGKNTLVQKTRADLGPGVDIVVGDKFVGLVKAPTSLIAKASGSGC